MTSVRFLVAGRVQGVRFRASTRERAQALGLSGRATTLPDGRVEVVAAGPDAAVEALAAWLAQGPPGARVDAVQRMDADERPPAGFSIG